MIEFMSEDKLKSEGYKEGKGYFYKKTNLGGYEVFIRCKSCGRLPSKAVRVGKDAGRVSAVCEICRTDGDYATNEITLPKQIYKILNKSQEVK